MPHATPVRDLPGFTLEDIRTLAYGHKADREPVITRVFEQLLDRSTFHLGLAALELRAGRRSAPRVRIERLRNELTYGLRLLKHEERRAGL